MICPPDEMSIDDLAFVPIRDEDLRGAAVMAVSVSELRAAIQELHEAALVAQVNQASMLRTVADLAGHLQALIKDIQEERSDLAGSNATLKRLVNEAARGQLPIWFWRQETGLELKVQLYRRASFLLHEAQYGVDDTWDLLTEYMTDYVGLEVPVTDAQLQGVIEYAKSHRWEGGA